MTCTRDSATVSPARQARQPSCADPRPRRRGALPGGLPGAAALGLALLAAAGGAEAREQTVVENFGQGADRGLEVGDVAQTFLTGPNPGGYTVTHVRLRASARPRPAGASSTLRAMLCNVDAGGRPPDNPGSCTWTGTARFLDAGDLDFELERPVRLLPETRYAIVADRTAGALPPLAATASGSADSASSAGWDIGAGGRAWHWKMTMRANGTFHERWERVPWARHLRFGLYGSFNLLNEPNGGNPPVFRDDDGLVELAIAENRPEGANVGSRLSDIVDRRGQTVTYSIVPDIAGNEIGGPDGDLFDIDPQNGQVTAKRSFDFESAKEHYRFGVSASNAIGASDGINVRVTVTDVNEPPAALAPCDGISPGGRGILCGTDPDPGEFHVRARSDTEIRVNWARPNPARGVPGPRSWLVVHRTGTSGPFDSRRVEASSAPGYAHVIEGLEPDTAYQVRVIVDNGEGNASSEIVTVRTHAHPQHAFRLAEASGTNPRVGRPEFLFRGKWGTVTDDRADAAGNAAAALMCRLAGFGDGEHVAAPAAQLGRHYREAPASRPVWLDDLRCAATDTGINQCSHAGWGNSNGGRSEDLWLRCWTGTPATAGPRPLRAWIGDGAPGWLYIQFDTTLEAAPGRTPGPGSFTVRVAPAGGGAEESVTATSVEVFADTGRVRLRLAREMTGGESVRVSYTDGNPGGNDAGGVLEDRFGADAPSFTGIAADNGAGGGPGPQLRAGETGTDGRTVTLWFTEPLDRSALPDPGRFTVRVTTRQVVADGQGNGTSVDTHRDSRPAAVAFAARADLGADARSRIAGKSACSAAPHLCALVLTMSDRDRIRGQDLRTYSFANGVSRAIPIRSGHRAVKARYAGPGPANDAAGAVRDAAGNRARGSHFVSVRNRTTWGRGLLPLRAYVSPDRDDVTHVVFEWPLSEEGFPTQSELYDAFSLTADGAPLLHASINRVAGAGNRLRISHGNVSRGADVRLRYDRPAGDDALKGPRGIEVASFEDYPVANPEAPPTLRFAALATPLSVELYFGGDMDTAAVPGSGSFHVLRDGTRLAVDRAAFDDGDPRVLRLHLSAPIAADEPATFRYERPADGSGLRSADGVELAGTAAADLARASEPLLSVSDVTVTRGIDTAAAFTVTLLPRAAGTVTVDYATSDGTATAPADYTAASGTLAFDAGETERTVSVPVSGGTAEEGRTFTLALSNAANARVEDAAGLATILPEMRIVRAYLDSGNPFLVFSHDVDAGRLPGAAAFAMTVRGEPAEVYRVGTVFNSSREITLEAEILADPGDEVTVSYARPATGSVLASTIGSEARSFERFMFDNPAGPVLRIADASGAEGEDATIGFAVTLLPAADEEVTVEYYTYDGTARAPGDYTHTEGTLTFAPGETEKTASVPIDGAIGTAEEYFGVDLRAAMGGNAAISQIRFGAFGTILPGLRVVRAHFETGNPVVSFSQDIDTDSFPAATAFTVTINGVASTIHDVYGVGGRASDITLEHDPAADPGDAVTVSYARPSSGNVLVTTGGLDVPDFTVAAENPAVPVLRVSDVAVTEGVDATADFTVTMRPAATETVTVDYETFDGSAEAPGDYAHTEGTLTFLPGETSKTVPVPVVDDDVEDDGETFLLGLSDVMGGDAVISSTFASAGQATIYNDERATPPPAPPLTAAFGGLPDAHGGEPFTVGLAFSEAPALSYRLLQGGDGQAGAIAVAGGAVTRAARETPGDSTRWTLTVEPDGTDDVTLTLPATADCEAADAICTGDGRPLSAAVAATVPEAAPGDAPVQDARVAEAPFTVRLEGLPEEHDGSGAVAFEVRFSEEPHEYSYRTLRDETLEIRQGGTRLAPAVRRKEKASNRAWTVTAVPESRADVTVRIVATAGCDDPGAACNADGEPLAEGVAATVPGPPGLSAADAAAGEAAGATLDFRVTLGRASSAAVRVDWATSDGTATAGADYVAASGTLGFAPGETERTVSVAVLDDAHDEGAETMTLALSNPSGGNAWLEDATATGTIENSDLMPGAWLARFGRTAAEQALDAVRARMSADRSPGFHGRFAGQPLPGPSAGGAMADGTEGSAPALAASAAGDGLAPFRDLPADAADGGPGRAARTLAAEDVLPGTAFTAFLDEGAGGSAGFWGGATRSGFAGRVAGPGGGMSVEGRVTSVRLGVDRGRKGAIHGLMAFASRGEGGYAGPEGAGAVETGLSGLVPYAGRTGARGLSVWGAAGIGRGEMTLTPEGGRPMAAGLDWAMAAAGAESPPATAAFLGGAELGWRADALWTRTASEAAEGLAASEAGTTRLRLGLRAAWERTLASGATVTPDLEVGMRHDGGDAETGFGLEAGGGLRYADPGSGLSVSVRGRTLAAHEDGGFGSWSLGLDVAWDPRPETRRGVSVIASRGWGAAPGGVDALLGPEAFPGLPEAGGAGDWSLEAAHGASRGRGMVGSRYVRMSGTGEDGRARLGWRVGPDATHAADARVDLWAGAGTDGAGAGAGAELQWRW